MIIWGKSHKQGAIIIKADPCPAAAEPVFTRLRKLLFKLIKGGECFTHSF